MLFVEELKKFMLKIEVFYINAQAELFTYACILPLGATVQEALQQTPWFIAPANMQELTLGIFSKPVNLDTVLQNGDRIEIYRPLLQDPKERRRKKTKKTIKNR